MVNQSGRVPHVRRLFAKWVGRAGDAKLERRFGSRLAQRVMFTAMVTRFNPDAAGDFQGQVGYELGRPATGAPPIRWTIEVSGRRAHASRGSSDDAAVKLRVTLADFVRIGAGTIDPATPVLQGRASFQGDFGLAVRLPEMFGASPPRRGRD
jgi:putative sterol carrier protein